MHVVISSIGLADLQLCRLSQDFNFFIAKIRSTDQDYLATTDTAALL